MARRNRIAAAAAGTKPVADTLDKGATSPLDDPAKQFEILNPQTLTYTLHLDGVDREISVKTVFSISDIMERRVLDDLHSYSKLCLYEIGRCNPDQSELTGDLGWVAKYPQFVDIAMAKATVKEAAREIVSRIAKFTGPPIVDGAHERSRPTSDELALGMDSTDLAALSLILLNRYFADISKRKNGQRTATVSA